MSLNNLKLCVVVSRILARSVIPKKFFQGVNGGRVCKPNPKKVSKNNCFELFATEPLWGRLRTSFWEDQVCRSSKMKKFLVGNFEKCCEFLVWKFENF